MTLVPIARPDPRLGLAWPIAVALVFSAAACPSPAWAQDWALQVSGGLSYPLYRNRPQLEDELHNQFGVPKEEVDLGFWPQDAPGYASSLSISYAAMDTFRVLGVIEAFAMQEDPPVSLRNKLQGDFEVSPILDGAWYVDLRMGAGVDLPFLGNELVVLSGAVKLGPWVRLNDRLDSWTSRTTGVWGRPELALRVRVHSRTQWVLSFGYDLRVQFSDGVAHGPHVVTGLRFGL